MNKKRADFNNPDYKRALKNAFRKLDEGEEISATEEKTVGKPPEAKKTGKIPDGVDSLFSVESVKKKLSEKRGKLSYVGKKFHEMSWMPPEDECEEENIDLSALAVEELKTKKDYFEGLLDYTADIVENSVSEQDQMYVGKISDRWDSALKSDELKGLSHKIKTACEEKKPADDIQKLQIILNVFYEMGLKKLEFADGIVTLSAENRKYFENGKMFPDGSVCTVASNVWTYKGELYIQGLLGEAPQTGDDENNAESSEASEETENADALKSDDCDEGLSENDNASLNENVTEETENRNITVPMLGCSAKFKDKSTFVLELLITYKGTPRFMELETAENQIERNVKYAAGNGFKKLCVCIIGGDCFEWDSFRDLCDYVSDVSWEIPVELCAEVYGKSLTCENEKWIFENLRRFKLTFCISEKEDLSSWRQYGVLYNPVVRNVRLSVVKGNLSSLKDELTALLELGKKIQLDFPDLHKWDTADYQKFMNDISPLMWKDLYYNKNQLLPLEDSGCIINGKRCLETVDIDSTVCFCRYLSMEHLSYSDIPDISKVINCNHHCPAAKFSKNNFLEQLINASVKLIKENIL